MRLTKKSSVAFLPLFVCLFLAFSLWLYASMREEYTTVVEIPLEIRLPAGRTLETDITSSIRAQVQGAGWQLVNHFLSSSIRCVVYVPEKRIARDDAQTSISLARQLLTQAVQAPVGITIQRVMTDSVPIVVGGIIEKRVAVKPALDVEMREGFVIAQRPSVMPDSITIRGSRTVLSKISSWNTDVVRLRDVYESTYLNTSFGDSLSGLVSIPQVPVVVSLTVQQMAEIHFDDIPVVVVNAPRRHSYMVQPLRVGVTLRGGVENIAKILPENILASVEFADVAQNTTGTLKVRIQSTVGEVEVIQISPEYLRCSKRVASVAKLLP